MATIVDYLPKETQEEVQESQSSFRDAFNVPKEKTETVDKAKPKRSRSSGGSSRRSSGGGGSSTTSQNLPQSTIETPTPAAARGQTMESVRQKSQTLKRQLAQKGQAKQADLTQQFEGKRKIQPGQAVVRPYDRRDFLTSQGGYYKQGLARSFAQLPSQLGKLGPAIQYGKKPDDGFLSPLKYSEKLQKDEPFSVTPAFGTVTPETKTGFKTVTVGERQADIEFQRSLEREKAISKYEKFLEQEDKKLQERINKGEDFEKIQKRQQEVYAKANEQLNKRLDRLAKKQRKQQPDVLTKGRTGKVRQRVELVGDVGVAGVSSVAPGVGAAYFGSKGAYKSNVAETKGEQFEGFVEGSIGVGYGATAVSKAGKAVVGAEVEALGQQPIKYQGLQFGKEKGKTILKGTQKYGKLKRDITIYGDFIKEGDKGFFVPSSKGTATTTGQLKTRLLPFKGTDPKYYLEAQKFRVGSKGVTVPLAERASISVSKDTFVPDEAIGSIFQMQKGQAVPLSSFSRTGGKATTSFGGTLTRRTGKDTFESKGGEIIFGKKGGFKGIDFKQSGKIKVIDVGDDFGKGFAQADDTFKFVGKKGGRKTPLTSTFADDIAKNLGQSTKVTTKTTGTLSKGAGPSSVGATPSVGKGLAQTGKEVTKTTSRAAPSLLAGRASQDVVRSQRRIVAPRLGAGQRSANIQKGSLVSQFSGQGLKSDQGQTGGQTSLTGSNLTEKNITENIITGDPTPPGPKPPRPPRGDFFSDLPTPTGYFKLPNVARLGRGTGKKAQGARQPFKYTPSFTGSSLKIKGKPKFLGKSVGYNPLEIRGLSPKKKTKGKKKKKK